MVVHYCLVGLPEPAVLIALQRKTNTLSGLAQPIPVPAVLVVCRRGKCELPRRCHFGWEPPLARAGYAMRLLAA